jgi:NAD(P)-dependent dehydrogenase (short-subunit alcohol dehydrogenase family)
MKIKYHKPRAKIVMIRMKLLTFVLLLVSSWSCAQTEDETGTVLITGANRGIGLELARQYVADGWRVIGTARKPDAATELSELGATVLQLDVTDQESVERLARDLDGQAIDVLMNNAGILPMVRTVPDIDFDQFNDIMAVNTVGPMRVTQALLPNLRAGRMKKIVNTTSVLGSIAENTRGGFYGYRESKAALNMFTRSLAAELSSEGFTCIVMHPGWVQTDMGGPNAPVPVQESASGIRAVVTSISSADSGTFWTHSGEIMAW